MIAARLAFGFATICAIAAIASPLPSLPVHDEARVGFDPEPIVFRCQPVGVPTPQTTRLEASRMLFAVRSCLAHETQFSAATQARLHLVADALADIVAGRAADAKLVAIRTALVAVHADRVP